MNTFIKDIHYACRNLAKQPLFTLIVVGILAVGIAGTVTMFSIFKATCLRSLPIPHAKRVVYLENWNTKGYAGAFSEFNTLCEQNNTFEIMAAFHRRRGKLMVAGEPTVVSVMRSTPGLFELLGVHPALGRCFTVDEDHPTAPEVALLNHAFWQRRYKSDPDIIGQTLSMDKRVYTIIGVLPAEDIFLADQDLWIPLAGNRGRYALKVMGRLQRGKRAMQAEQDLLRISQSESKPQKAADEQLRVISARDYHSDDSHATVIPLLGAVGLVLLIACCNVSGLLLARGAYQSRELGVRAALGASRRQIMQQVLSESLVLTVLGLGAGLLLSQWARALDTQINWLYWMIPGEVSFAWDRRFLVFCLALVMGTTLCTGLLPALQGSHPANLLGLLKSGSMGNTESRRYRRSLNAIVVGEIALALSLLIGAGLLLRSFHKMRHTEPGYLIDNILFYQINASSSRFEEHTELFAFFQDHLDRVHGLPGVESAGLTYKVPLYDGGQLKDRIVVEKGRAIIPGQKPQVYWHPVTPDYLATMGIQLLAGRGFTEQDSHPGTERTVIVSQSVADTYWPQESPLGKRLRFTGRNEPWYRIIGITQDTRFRGLDQAIPLQLYLPYSLERWESFMTMVIRTSQSAESLESSIVQFIKAADPTMPVPSVNALSRRRDSGLYYRHMASIPYYSFALIAGSLATLGLYGVMAYAVSQRTQEFGIRLALGAQPHNIVRQILRHGAVLIGAGLCLGALGGLVVSRVLSSMVFGVGSLDPVTYLGMAALLAGVTLLACAIPARRAARVDPMEALRYE